MMKCWVSPQHTESAWNSTLFVMKLLAEAEAAVVEEENPHGE
jgi:hypothetical protein